MPSDRSHWQPYFRYLPRWECPTCGKGHLKVVGENRHEKESGPSAKAHGHDAWDPSWVSGRFVCLLECDFAPCEEIASVSGTYIVDFEETFDYEGRPEQTWVDFFQVQAISPSPLPIRPIKATPETIKNCLAKAAALLWQSEEAAANGIRQAIEHLMDARKIKKFTTGNGKRTRMMLHARIEEFRKEDQENGDILLAVKWLGNSGSHVGGLTRDDVLDAFDMIELTLENLYGTTKATIMRKVKAVNKKKGPVSK